VPDYFYVYHLYADYIKSEYGSINGVDSYKRAMTKINNYNEKHGSILTKIAQTDDGETCVVVCDNLEILF